MNFLLTYAFRISIYHEKPKSFLTQKSSVISHLATTFSRPSKLSKRDNTNGDAFNRRLVEKYFPLLIS